MDKIKVAIKVRPLVLSDKETTEFWRVVGNELHVLDNDGHPTGEKYAFDHVFGKSATNVEVFEQIIKPLVDRAVNGFNVTVCAYGQTSSGKTHTMLGDENEVGIIQLVVSSMFDFMKKSEGREFLVRASYMEIYNESVNDLFQHNNRNLKIREKDGEVIVDRLKEELIADTSKMLNLLKRGQNVRRIGATNLNENSSRSHTIFRMIIESRVSDNIGDEPIKTSQLNLVDLAGSERADQVGTYGERLKEGCAINRSLFQLSQVVSKLSEGSQFVNFRDSKLTRILQPSLGGNAHTLIICTVTPASLEMTMSTLGFASRAKAVKNKPVVNEVMSDGTLIKKYACQLKKLQAEVKAAKERNSIYRLETVENKLEEQERLNNELQQRINFLTETLIVGDPGSKSRPKRRRTWGGQRDLMKPRLSMLGTVHEIVKTSLVLPADGDSNLPFEDFEVQLIEYGEKSSELNTSFVSDISHASIPSHGHISSRISNISTISSLAPNFDMKEDAVVQTSPTIDNFRRPLSCLHSDADYWEKEYNELSSFTRHEKDIFEDLAKQLNHKEQQCKELQATLAVKEDILKDTLILQESLTEKLLENESSQNSHKIQELVEVNSALQEQLQKLKYENRVCNEQISAFRKNLYTEITSLNPKYAKEVLELSDPSCIVRTLMECIMQKPMEVFNNFHADHRATFPSMTEQQSTHNDFEAENNELHASLERLQEEILEFRSREVVYIKKTETLQLKHENLKIHYGEKLQREQQDKENLQLKIQELEKCLDQVQKSKLTLQEQLTAMQEVTLHQRNTGKFENYSCNVVKESQSKKNEIHSKKTHWSDSLSINSNLSPEKDALKRKVAELEKTSQFLQDTLTREGYMYEAPYWVRKGSWAISNRKMRHLEKRVQELEHEVNTLRGNNTDTNEIEDSIVAACQNSPTQSSNYRECSMCKNLREQLSNLKEETGLKSLRISVLTSKLERKDSEYKVISENLEEDLKILKSENKRLQESLQACCNDLRKYQTVKRHQETQTVIVPMAESRLRALGTGSKIVNDYTCEVPAERITELSKEKAQLKQLVSDLRKQIQQLEKGSSITPQNTANSTTLSGSISSPRRKAAQDRLVQDAAMTMPQRQQPWPCAWQQDYKENPVLPSQQKETEIKPPASFVRLMQQVAARIIEQEQQQQPWPRARQLHDKENPVLSSQQKQEETNTNSQKKKY